MVIQVDKRAVLRQRLVEAIGTFGLLAVALAANLVGDSFLLLADIMIGILCTFAMVQAITTWANLHEDGLE